MRLPLISIDTISRCLIPPCLLMFLCCMSMHAANPLQVKTDKGVVEGAATADGKVLAFKGIPYAAPPVDELRWKGPQPVARWKRILPAHDFGHHCIQSATYPDMVFHDAGPSEDCLTLNVWAPAPATGRTKAKAAGLPVMVWVYGGGFLTGGTSENRQDGQFLAHRGVVVVSMEYRLGVFGFMAHPELTAESGHGASGNYGLLDQAAAIDWVQRNIAAFGGDPANVTIFGESAGSFSVSALMASPLVKGKIARAIGESGGAFSSAGLGFPKREEAEDSAVNWAEHAFGSSKIFNLRTMSTEEILKAAKATGAPRFGPDVDGYFLPASVATLYASGQQAHLPLLAGWNADESHAKGRPTAESFKAQAAAEFGANASDLLAVYPATTDAEAVASANSLAGDRFIAYSTWKWIEAQVQTGGAPVYRYFLDLGSPGDKNHSVGAGAFHSDDIEYVFGALNSRPGMVQRPEDRKLSEQMGQYWTNFARTGDPNGPGLPKWPVYTDAVPMVMHLNADSAAKTDAYRGRYLFLDSTWSKPKE